MNNHTQNSTSDNKFFTGLNGQPKNFEVPKSSTENDFLKKGVWAYFILLIFEGALRKWVLPELATPLLIVRDPIAVGLVFTAWHRGMLRINFYIGTMVVIGLIGIFTALFLGHGNLPVALFGARILVIHFPLMFVIGRIFTREDVVQMAKISLVIAIPMAVLIFLQFYSPQSAWVNRGVGGDEKGAGYSGALGFFRPPGTFSFTTGTTLFFSFIAPLVCYFWISSEKINKIVLVGATIGLLSAIPLSISRSLLFGVGVTVIFTIIGVSRTPKYFGKVIGAAVFVTLALILLSKASFFATSTEVFSSRFENASETEGGMKNAVLYRLLGGLYETLSAEMPIPFWGYGVGMGTNVGSMLLSGSVTYLVAEGEWGRLVGELGPIMGLIAIFARMSFCITVAVAAYKRLVKGDLLPWLLLSNLLIVVPQGQWAQPTSLGFSTLIGGLIISSFRNPVKTF